VEQYHADYSLYSCRKEGLFLRPEIVKQHPFLDQRRASGYSYYKLPKAMLAYGKQLGISTDETLLYMILKERTKLSYKNAKYDKDGNIYIYYTRADAAKYLGWSLRKTVDVFQALVDHGLLHETDEFTGKGKRAAKKLYVRMWMQPNFNFTLQDIKEKNFPPITIENLFDADIGDYYVLPKMLIEDEIYHGLSLRAILLYMISLDRIYLSLRYNRVDENGLLWTTIDTDILQQELGCSDRSLSRAFKELEEIGLIERRAVAYAEKWRIYVRDFMPQADVTLSPTPTKYPGEDSIAQGGQDCTPSDAKSAPLSRQICTTVSPDLHDFIAKSASVDSPNLQPSNISLEKNQKRKLSFETSIPAPSYAARDVGCLPQRKEENTFSNLEYTTRAMELIHYEETVDLIHRHTSDLYITDALNALEECLMIVMTDLVKLFKHRLPAIVFGKDSVPIDEVLNHYQALSPHIMLIVIRKLLEQSADIKDRQAYIHKTLFLASQQHSQYAYHLRREIENNPSYQFLSPAEGSGPYSPWQ